MNGVKGYCFWSLLITLHLMAVLKVVYGKKTLCPRINAPTNGSVVYRKTDKRGRIVPGAKARFHCMKEFMLSPPSRRSLKCKKGGKWSHHPPLCVVKRCRWPPSLKIFKNGKYKVDIKTLTPDATISFDCNDNFQMIGVDSMTCRLNSQGAPLWFPPKPPKCREIRCPDPGRPSHGRRFGSRFKIGSKVRFSCNSGYKLIGSEERICQQDGRWSGKLTVCDDQESDCDDPGIPINGRRYGDKFTLGSKVRFDCKVGVLVGSKERICKMNRTWTGSQPTCDDESILRIPSLNETVASFKKNMMEPLAPDCTEKKGQNCAVKKFGRSLQLNNPQGLDLVFLIDSSSSIGKKNFKLALEFVCFIIRTFKVNHGPGGTRVAAVTFSNKPTLAYNLRDNSVDSTGKACQATRSIKYSGGGTGTRLGLDMVYNLVAPNFRPMSVRAVLIIADGNSNFGGNPGKSSRKLENDFGADIYAFGVGKKIRRAELRTLASSKNDNIFHLASYEEFDNLINGLVTEDRYADCGISGVEDKGRIFQGIESSTSEWPWQVAIFRSQYDRVGETINVGFVGGGAILDKYFILTAAHVVPDDETNSYHFVAGHKDLVLNNPEKTRLWLYNRTVGLRASRIIKHKDFNKYNFANDIAIVKLKEPLSWSSTVRPVCLPQPEEYVRPEMYGYVSGWGGVDSKRRFSETLRHQYFAIQTNKTCSDSVDKGKFNRAHHFCAGDRKVVDACQGDSGGPFVVEMPNHLKPGGKSFKVMGIVSWGHRTCDASLGYGFYTRVSSYLDWIQLKRIEYSGEN